MAQDRIDIAAPAKLNLFLHITGQRSDGYHELQTLFQFIDFQDELQVQSTLKPDIELNGDLMNLPVADNLIYRAARLLQSHTGCQLGARIHIRKALPAGAGLGGGSSDAASTLLALNQLWRVNLTTPELMQLGLRLGADVPVFINGEAAIATGVGEKLTAYQPAEDWHLLMIPACHVATAQLFADKHLTRNTVPITISAISEGVGHNDFEPVARRLFPLIDTGFDLLARCGTPRLTGTGACLFNSYAERSAADHARSNVQRDLTEAALTQAFTVRVTKGLNRSPALVNLQQARHKT